MNRSLRNLAVLLIAGSASVFAQSGDISGAFAPATRVGWLVIAIFALIGSTAGALVYRAGRHDDGSPERRLTGAVGFVVSLVVFVVCLVRLLVGNK